jgi:hypothetical protein
MPSVIAGSQFRIEPGQRRVLLVSPPVCDLRLDWARWLQPSGLLRLGAALRQQGADVRLFDFLAEGTNDGRVTRRRAGTLSIGSEQLTWWLFGLPWAEAARRVLAWRAEGWQPDEVWVTSLTSFWQRGVQDVIRRVKYDWWPQARVVLGGVYPTLYPDHAAASSDADLIVSGPVGGLSPQVDLSFYPATPPCAGIYLDGAMGSAQRPAEDVLDEMAAKARRGIREFAFFDESLPGPDPDRFAYVLEGIARRSLKVRLSILGNLPAREVTPFQSTLLHDANMSEVYLSWDTALNGDMTAYEAAAQSLQTYGGLKPRDGSLSAIVHAGWPRENLQSTTTHLLHLAHVVGSVTIFPYQPTPQEGAQLGVHEPNLLNGKLYPFAETNGVRFADYADLLRLAAMLNSKYRDVTFDFLGDDMISRMIRASIRDHTWQPAKPAPDGTRQLAAESNTGTSVGLI